MEDEGKRIVELPDMDDTLLAYLALRSPTYLQLQLLKQLKQ
jgi:hypothetical protein